MSEAKHTPGPYRFQAETGDVVTGHENSDAPVARVLLPDGFADFDPEESDIKAICEEFHATGVLLAAAPDLLAALQQILPYLDQFAPVPDDPPYGAIVAAHAAIARATGAPS